MKSRNNWYYLYSSGSSEGQFILNPDNDAEKKVNMKNNLPVT